MQKVTKTAFPVVDLGTRFLLMIAGVIVGAVIMGQ